MTRREIIDQFHGLMDSYNRVYWNDTRATVLLNTIKNRLAQEFTYNRVEQYYTFNSVQGQQNYEVPSTFIANRWMYFDSGYNRHIDFYDGPESIYGPAADQDIEGIPQAAFIWGVSGRRQLTIYPTFSEDDIEVQWWFYGWPPDVAVDNDEPALPIEWHPSLVEIMIAEHQAFDREIGIGDRILVYKDCANRIKRMDVTRQLTHLSDTQSGSIDSHFPTIPISTKSPVDFSIQFPSGAVEKA